jgi:hypothetical protein
MYVLSKVVLMPGKKLAIRWSQNLNNKGAGVRHKI